MRERCLSTYLREGIAEACGVADPVLAAKAAAQAAEAKAASMAPKKEEASAATGTDAPDVGAGFPPGMQLRSLERMVLFGEEAEALCAGFTGNGGSDPFFLRPASTPAAVSGDKAKATATPAASTTSSGKAQPVKAKKVFGSRGNAGGVGAGSKEDKALEEAELLLVRHAAQLLGSGPGPVAAATFAANGAASKK